MTSHQRKQPSFRNVLNFRSLTDASASRQPSLVRIHGIVTIQLIGIVSIAPLRICLPNQPPNQSLADRYSQRPPATPTVSCSTRRASGRNADQSRIFANRPESSAKSRIANRPVAAICLEDRDLADFRSFANRRSASGQVPVCENLKFGPPQAIENTRPLPGLAASKTEKFRKPPSGRGKLAVCESSTLHCKDEPSHN